MQKLVTEVRRFRSDQGLADRQKVPARLVGRRPKPTSTRQMAAVTSLAWLTDAGRWLQPDGVGRGAAVARHGAWSSSTRSGTVDVAAERRRLEKDLAAAQKELAGTTAKLDNEAFLAKAPDDVVDKIRDRQQLAREEVDRITARLARSGPMTRLRESDARTRSRRCFRSSTCSTSAGRRPRSSRAPTRISALMELLGSPQLRLPVDPHRGHQRQDVGGADGRRAADRAAPAHRPHHQPAPAVGGRAHRHRRQADQPGAVRRRPTARSSRSCRWWTSSPRPPAGPAMSKFEVVTAHGVRGVRRRPDRRRRSSRSASAAAGTPPTSSTRRSRSSPRSASTTPITSAPTSPSIAGEKAGIITKQPDDLVPDRHRRGHRRGRRPRRWRCCWRRRSAADAAVAREDSEFAVLGRQVAVGGQLLRAAGPRRGVLRDLPAAARRAPGAQRGGRAGRRRGVLRRGRGPPTRHRRRPGRFRGGHQPRAAGADAHARQRFSSMPRTTRPVPPPWRRRWPRSSTSGSWSGWSA